MKKSIEEYAGEIAGKMFGSKVIDDSIEIAKQCTERMFNKDNNTEEK